MRKAVPVNDASVDVMCDLADKCAADVSRDLKNAIDLASRIGMSDAEFVGASTLISSRSLSVCADMLAAILLRVGMVTKKEAGDESFCLLVMSHAAKNQDLFFDKAIEQARADMRARKVNQGRK